MRFIPELAAVLPWLVVAAVAAAAIALGSTPLVRRLAVRAGLVDLPDRRRVNTRPIPRAGGIAVAAAFLIVASGFVIVDAASGAISPPSFLDAGQLIALLLGGAGAAILGLVDDALQLRARWQLAGQLGLAGFAIWLGIGVESVNIPFADRPLALDGILEVAFTTFWIVGMINAINFIDGLDGLSAGIGGIAAVTLGIISLTTTIGQPYVAVLCFALAGALLGFLRWNFHPAVVFAGTSGTMFLGYALAILAVLGSAKVAVAVLVLGVPIIDTFWIIVRRLATGRMPFSPDRGHIHHRLLDLGLGHRQAVLLIYGICAALAALALLLSGTGQVYAFLGLVVGLGLVLFFLTRR
ncbi:MAG: undecaprenyl-phosphate alpha-N-acetylglucosaminyl 1-phosphate transferase, partial [Chloroflexota bacterium]